MSKTSSRDLVFGSTYLLLFILTLTLPDPDTFVNNTG